MGDTNNKATRDAVKGSASNLKAEGRRNAAFVGRHRLDFAAVMADLPLLAGLCIYAASLKESEREKLVREGEKTLRIWGSMAPNVEGDDLIVILPTDASDEAVQLLRKRRFTRSRRDDPEFRGRADQAELVALMEPFGAVVTLMVKPAPKKLGEASEGVTPPCETAEASEPSADNKSSDIDGANAAGDEINTPPSLEEPVPNSHATDDLSPAKLAVSIGGESLPEGLSGASHAMENADASPGNEVVDQPTARGNSGDASNEEPPKSGAAEPPKAAQGPISVAPRKPFVMRRPHMTNA